MKTSPSPETLINTLHTINQMFVKAREYPTFGAVEQGEALVTAFDRIALLEKARGYKKLAKALHKIFAEWETIWRKGEVKSVVVAGA